jgi:hypothetical protein
MKNNRSRMAVATSDQRFGELDTVFILASTNELQKRKIISWSIQTCTAVGVRIYVRAGAYTHGFKFTRRTTMFLIFCFLDFGDPSR